MRSIERYLLGWILGALGLGALVMALAAYLVTLEEMNEVYDADLKHVAEALGSYLHADSATAPDAARHMPERRDLPAPEEIVTILWTSGGQRVYSSDPRVAIPFMTIESLTRTRVGDEEWIVYTDVSDNGVAQAAQRVFARHETAAESASKILPTMVVLALGITVLLVIALRRGLRPLDEAAQEIAARSARTLSPMNADEMPRELSPLVLAINGLMGRLAEALATQRRFLGDAAHELRTPVTALRLQLQLLRQSSDEDAKQRALRELQAGIDRAQHLIEKLLQVARSDPDAQAQPHERVALGDLVRDVVAGSSAEADHRGVDLGAKVSQEVIALGEAPELRVLLVNLVENALRHAPAGGVVDVEALELEGRPALRVIDNGPGIPVQERERVFDRFYRGADAQRLAPDAGGSGLGLAIVRAIAERHCARVSLHTPAAGPGLEVRVVFQDAAQPAD